MGSARRSAAACEAPCCPRSRPERRRLQYGKPASIGPGPQQHPLRLTLSDATCRPSCRLQSCRSSAEPRGAVPNSTTSTSASASTPRSGLVALDAAVLQQAADLDQDRILHLDRLVEGPEIANTPPTAPVSRIMAVRPTKRRARSDLVMTAGPPSSRRPARF